MIVAFAARAVVLIPSAPAMASNCSLSLLSSTDASSASAATGHLLSEREERLGRATSHLLEEPRRPHRLGEDDSLPRLRARCRSLEGTSGNPDNENCSERRALVQRGRVRHLGGWPGVFRTVTTIRAVSDLPQPPSDQPGWGAVPPPPGPSAAYPSGSYAPNAGYPPSGAYPPAVGGPAQPYRPPMATPIPAGMGATMPSTRLGANAVRGLLAALGAGLVGGLVWYGIVVTTERQIYYLAVILGLFIGYAASWGSGRGGAGTMILAAVVALITVVASYYYIDRYFLIQAFEGQGFSVDIPLLPGYSMAKDVLRTGFETEGSQYLFCVLCVAAAGFFGFKGVQTSRRFGR